MQCSVSFIVWEFSNYQHFVAEQRLRTYLNKALGANSRRDLCS